MNLIHNEAPLKVLIEDLSRFEKSNDFWIYKFKEKPEISLKLNKIHMQGVISKTSGFLKEILIVSDGTGKTKVTRGSRVPGDLSWIDEGSYGI